MLVDRTMLILCCTVILCWATLYLALRLPVRAGERRGKAGRGKAEQMEGTSLRTPAGEPGQEDI